MATRSYRNIGAYQRKADNSYGGVRSWPDIGAAQVSDRITNALRAFWDLDETSGDRADRWNGYTLTAINAPGSTTGLFGNAATFVAASSQSLEYASVSGTGLDVVGKSFTFAVWFQVASSSGSYGLARNHLASLNATSWSLEYDGTSHQVMFRISGGGGSTARAYASVTASPGTWYLAVARFNYATNAMRVAVNAGTPGTATLGGGDAIYPWNGEFTLGVGRESGYLDGALDQPMLWHREISDDEEAWLYNDGDGRSPSDIEAQRGGWVTKVFETFTGTNFSSIDSRDPDLGDPWDVISGEATIFEGKSNTSTGGYAINQTPLGDKQFVQFTVGDRNNQPMGWLCGDESGGNLTGYRLWVFVGFSVELHKFTGSGTSVGSSLKSWDGVNNGDVVRLEFDGIDTFTLYVNGVQSGSSYTDPSPVVGGKAGLVLGPGSGGMDNFEAGDWWWPGPVAVGGGATPITASDTASLSVSESRDLLSLLARTDSGALTATESAAINGIVTAMDSCAITVADAVALLVALTRSDTATLTVTEARALANVVAVTDAPALTVTEARALQSFVSITDTPTLTVSDALAILAILTRGDDATLTVSDLASLAGEIVTKALSDSATLTVSEAATLLSLLARTDAAALAVTGSASIAGTLTTSDLATLAAGDTVTLTATLNRADALTLGVTDGAISVILTLKTASDTASLSVSDASSMAALLARTDAAGLSITQTLGPIQVTLARADSVALSIAESRAILAALSRADLASLALGDAAALTVISLLGDTLRLSVTEAGQLVAEGHIYLAPASDRTIRFAAESRTLRLEAESRTAILEG